MLRILVLFLSLNLLSDVNKFIDASSKKYDQLALDLWDYAEMGYQEVKSSNALKKVLKEEGFSIRSNIAGIPTAFIAEYNNGGPIIAILFGAGSVHAAVAVKRWLRNTNTLGTIRLYGTPAEEGGSGKVYIAREGEFKDVDTVLHWHPDTQNRAHFSASNGNKSAKFKFKGISSHAAGAPQNGRSALDGVEAMNMMVNMLREHMDEEARIHYVITKGGLAPNVVPEEAEVYYYVRHPNVDGVRDLFNRVVKAAEGASQGTETQMTFEVMHGNYPLMPNRTLSEVVNNEMLKLGGISYTKEEEEFAKKIYKTLINPRAKIGDQEEIKPLVFQQSKGSTDVGDISWLVPTSGARVATWVPGTSAHSWQAVSAGGMSIGTKGTNLAAKVLGNTAVALFKNPKIIDESKKELMMKVGDHQYQALLGDRSPPLDYRN